MWSYRRELVYAGALWLGFGLAPGRAEPPSKVAPSSANDADVQKLAARIDALIGQRLQAARVTPALPADDAEYLRRVYLDLAGTIPVNYVARDFLENDAPDKRQRLVDDLLTNPDRDKHKYVRNFTNVWRALLLPQANNADNDQVRSLVPSLEAWLRERLVSNTPYDEMVRELLLAAPGYASLRGAGSNPNAPTTSAFYAANESKPENLAASAARLFLGIKLECAQCHDHPQAQWTRNQFWEFAAFFNGIQIDGQSRWARQPPGQAALAIPGTQKMVFARYLDGTEPRWTPGQEARAALVAWMTLGDNPYFARTAANRLWAHFFGIGLIDPVDDANEQNPPSHPELLDELARQLIAHRYDLQFLIRALTRSQTYQRTSARTHPSQEDPRFFARMPIKGLTPEQLAESLKTAIAYPTSSNPRAMASNREDSMLDRLLARFTLQEKRTEHQTSILQALALMNGKLVAEATHCQDSYALAAIADSPSYKNTAERIEALYLSALSRRPSAAETARLVKYVDNGGTTKNWKEALADVFWALLNSAEFALNH